MFQGLPDDVNREIGLNLSPETIKSIASTVKTKNIIKDEDFKRRYLAENEYNFREWVKTKSYWLISEYFKQGGEPVGDEIMICVDYNDTVALRIVCYYTDLYDDQEHNYNILLASSRGYTEIVRLLLQDCLLYTSPSPRDRS